ncbi:MAG: hypothetical protein PHH09_04590 [Methanoregulaceae archaeon]|nr:hypothetical protein [Methanoregulaceae archaeon]
MLPKNIFLDRVEELADEIHDDILKAARELLKTEAVDLEKYEDDFLLPKLFLTSYASRMYRHWSPPMGILNRYKNEIEKMEAVL